MENEFDKKRRKKISTLLERSLGPEYLSLRAGVGSSKFVYVEGWKIINLANKIFGFDGWSSEIKSLNEEFKETTDGKILVGFSCLCRVTLRNGIFREDIGFGSSENQKALGTSIEKAKKEASTDALKRALRLFGSALGNCCYNKQYLLDVHKHNEKGKIRSFNFSKLLHEEDFQTQEDRHDVSFSQSPEFSDA